MEKLIDIKTKSGIQLTDPELAVRWWGRLSDEEKQLYLNTYLPSYEINEVDYETMYYIWLKKQELPEKMWD
jgi:hypothetical protein